MPYFGEPVGRVKIQTTSKNTQRYYTTKRLIRDLLSNTPNFHVRGGEFRGYLFTGNAWQEYAKRNGIGAGNPANWLVNSRWARQTGFCGFDQATTGAIYFTFHNGRERKETPFDRPNYTSIQVFLFKISVNKKRREEIRFDKQKFWKTTNFITIFMVKQFSSKQVHSYHHRPLGLRFFFAWKEA